MTFLPPVPCNLNGEFTRLAEAKIGVMNRHFVFADGVYEGSPSMILSGGKPAGTGQPGPIYHQLYAGYQAAKQRPTEPRTR